MVFHWILSDSMSPQVFRTQYSVWCLEYFEVFHIYANILLNVNEQFFWFSCSCFLRKKGILGFRECKHNTPNFPSGQCTLVQSGCFKEQYRGKTAVFLPFKEKHLHNYFLAKNLFPKICKLPYRVHFCIYFEHTMYTAKLRLTRIILLSLILK